MTPRQQLRRATIDDLPQLKALWEQEHLLSGELEKRFKEFQVVEGAGGEVLGGIGLQIAGQEGRLHSEVFLHFDQADALRELLWERAKTIAANFGLMRIWTQLDTLYWRQNVFEPASPERLEKLPPAFGGGARPWMVAQLKQESAVSAQALEQEIALLQAIERERTERIMLQARRLKWIATGMALLVFLLVIIWAFSFFKVQGRIPGR